MELNTLSRPVKPTLNMRAGAKDHLISEIGTYLASGVSLAAACELLIDDITRSPDGNLALAARTVSRNGAIPHVSTLRRCYEAANALGAAALAGNYKGRVRKDYGWEARAIELYNLPSKPAMSAVAMNLVEEGYDSATESRVRRYLKSLPAHLGKNSPARMGKRKYKDSQLPFIRRDTAVLKPGDIYQGDGHTVDVYVAHPATGKIWRPELTVWIDVASRCIVGWYLSEAESTMSTLYALSHALLSQNHIPAMLHIDNGSGFKGKMMAEESTGYYARFGIGTMFSLPYNAKGKGQVERWFGTMERQFGKFCPSYCGADMADEVLNKLARDINSGKQKLMSLEDYSSGLRQYIEQYNNRLHRSLDGQTPTEVWNGLKHSEVVDSPDVIVRPRVERIIKRSCIRLHNREYGSHELAQFNGSDVQVEYDLHNDESVRLLDGKGRWLCDAPLIYRKAYIEPSRIEQARKNRLKNQTKRLQNKIDEAERRSNASISHDRHIEALESGNLAAERSLDAPDQARSDADRSPKELDILNLDY